PVVDLVAKDAEADDAHLAVSADVVERIGAGGLVRIGVDPTREGRELLNDVLFRIVERPDAYLVGDRAIGGLRVRLVARLELVAEREGAGAIDCERVLRPVLGRLGRRRGRRVRMLGPWPVPVSGL